ncbi:MAG: tagaturonate reductase [Paludibacter sp.]
MEKLSRKSANVTKTYPERIIQFGEGNFLRAFVDWIVFNMNNKADFNSSIVIVQPLEGGMIDMLNAQDGLYHLNLQGLDKGKPVDSIELIDVVSRCLNPYSEFDAYLKLAENPEMRFVVSNTTEAGIAFDDSCKLDDAPASSFPGKLTQLLFHRYKTFNGAADKGLIMLPCELIFHNGTELKKCIEQYIEFWNLGAEFKNWFETACGVYCTLVDRIVPGYPRDTIKEILEKTQLEDKMVVKAEIFHLWVIEAPEWVAKEFPADKAGLNVLFVPSEKPYHDRKVTLLNGPHTVMSPVAYLSGIDTVSEGLKDEVIGKFVNKVMYDELLETLDLPKEELQKFASDVLDRFRNPFVKHFYTSIMLNSFPKFKTRDLPGLKIYLERKGELPAGLVLGLAGIITYYNGGLRDEDEIIPNDDKAIIDLLKKLWNAGNMENIAKGVLGAEFIWGEDLNLVAGLTAKITEYLRSIRDNGMYETVKSIV